MQPQPTLVHPLVFDVSASGAPTIRPDGDGVPLDPTNGHLLREVGSLYHYFLPDKTLLRITATDVGGTVTVKSKPALAHLTFDVPANSTRWVGPFESATYSQPVTYTDGSVGDEFIFTASPGMTGTVAAFRIGGF